MNKPPIYIDAPIPIPFDKLAEILEKEEELSEGESITVGVNYHESEYKGKNLLYYIANIDVNIDIMFISDHDGDFEIDNALEVLTEYMSLNRISDVPSLNRLAAFCLARYAKLDVDAFFTPEFAFDKVKVDAWIEKNKEVVHKWHVFFQSLPIFMIESHAHVRKILPPDQVYKEIDDIKYVSLNIINLVKMPGFVDLILSARNVSAELFIFKEQFKEAIYNGKNLFHCLMEAESEVFAACISLFDSQTSIADLIMVSKAADHVEALKARKE